MLRPFLGYKYGSSKSAQTYIKSEMDLQLNMLSTKNSCFVTPDDGIERISRNFVLFLQYYSVSLHVRAPISVSTWRKPSSHRGCNRRNVRDFRRVFLRSNYTDITQNTYIQIWKFTEIMDIEMCGLLGCRRTVRLSWCHTCPMRLPGTRHGNAVTLASALQSAAACGKVLGSLRTTRVRVFL